MHNTEVPHKYTAITNDSHKVASYSSLIDLIQFLVSYFRKKTQNDNIHIYELSKFFIHDDKKNPKYVFLRSQFNDFYKIYLPYNTFNLSTPAYRLYYKGEQDTYSKLVSVKAATSSVMIVDNYDNPVSKQIIEDVIHKVIYKPSMRESNNGYMESLKYKKGNPYKIKRRYFVTPSSSIYAEESDYWFSNLGHSRYPKHFSTIKQKAGVIKEELEPDFKTEEFDSDTFEWRTRKSWKHNSKRRKQWKPKN